jgi:hypothetical protein
LSIGQWLVKPCAAMCSPPMPCRRLRQALAHAGQQAAAQQVARTLAGHQRDLAPRDVSG